MKRWSSRRRGFSLLEICVVLAIVGLLIAVGIPIFSGLRRRSEMSEAARRLMGNLRGARSLAAKGQTNTTWALGDRTVSSGVRIISATQYAVFIDRDMLTNGDEVDVTVIDFNTLHPGTALRIVNPAAPFTIRFRSTGVLNTTAPIDIDVRDTSNNQTKTIRVSPGGSAKLL